RYPSSHLPHSSLRQLLSLPPSFSISFLSSLLPRPPRPTPSPYTTLFRSGAAPARYPTLASIRVAAGCGWLSFRDAAEAASSRNEDRKSTRLNSSHVSISYAVFCLKKKNTHRTVPVDQLSSTHLWSQAR